MTDAVKHITTTEALYALEEVDIRGVRLKTFANAARLYAAATVAYFYTAIHTW